MLSQLKIYLIMAMWPIREILYTKHSSSGCYGRSRKASRLSQIIESQQKRRLELRGHVFPG